MNAILEITKPFLSHCAVFGYMQSPPPVVQVLQSCSVNFPVPQVWGQQRLISLAHVWQLSGKSWIAFSHVRKVFHSGERLRHSLLSTGIHS